MIKRMIIILLFILVAVLSVIIILQNFVIENTEYTISTDRISLEFDGFKIVQVSDLHSIRSQKTALYLIEMIKKQNPDIIVITGDLIDSTYYSNEKNNLDSADERGIPDNETIEFVKEIIKIGPVYYIYGNHEVVLLDDVINNPFKKELSEIGVVFLNNKSVKINKENSQINLLGIQDPSTVYKDKDYAYLGNSEETMKAMLNDLNKNIDKEIFTILLSHRPEYFYLYQDYSIDLILAGHAHGGQIRIPYVGGLYAPNQGFFPEYTAGEYLEKGIKMIVSRGIGNSKIPIRIFNPPELVTIVLNAEVTR